MLREVHGFISQCPPSPLLRAWLTYHVYLTKHILVSLNAFEKILSSFHGLFSEAWRSKFNRGKPYRILRAICSGHFSQGFTWGCKEITEFPFHIRRLAVKTLISPARHKSKSKLV